jgi:glycerol-3-phosphate acyltransferase PlsX
VFKSHGSADAMAFENALTRAYDAARNRLLDRVHQRIDIAMKTLPGSSIAAAAEPASTSPQAA